MPASGLVIKQSLNFIVVGCDVSNGAEINLNIETGF